MSTTKHKGIEKSPSTRALAACERSGTRPTSNGDGHTSRAPIPRPHRREVPLPRGQSTEAERPWRAAAVTGAGAGSILFFAYPRDLTLITDIEWLGLWGQIVGMVGLVLALFMVTYPRAANVIGPFAIIAGIVGFPIMLGGVLVGSFGLVLGGALAFSWEPAPPEARAEVGRSVVHLPLRIAAGTVDLALLVIAVAIPATTFLHDPMRDHPALTYLVEMGLWAAIFLPGAMRGVSPGKLLMRLRVWELGSTGRPGTRAAVIREAVRAAQFLVGVMLLPWIIHLPEAAGAVLGAGALAAVVMCAHVGWTPHDHLAGTEVVALRVVLPEDGTTESSQLDVDAVQLTTAEPALAAVASNGATDRSKNGAGVMAGAMRVHPAHPSPAPNGRGSNGTGAKRSRSNGSASNGSAATPSTTRTRAAAPGVTPDPEAQERRPRRRRAGQTGAASEDERARDPAGR